MRIKIVRHGGRFDKATLRRVIGTAALAPLAAAAMVGIDPARFRLSTTPVVLHAVSFRGPMAVGLTGAGIGTLLSTRFGRFTATGRPWRRLAAGGVLIAAGLSHGVIITMRGWAKPGSNGRAALVVISLNTLGGAATPAQIAALVSAELASADDAVVSLPESPESIATTTAELLAAAGHEFQVFSTSAGPRLLDSTSLLISAGLGTYRQLPAPDLLLGAVLSEPVGGDGPTIAAVHPGAPTSRVGYARWRADVTAAVAISREHPNSIVAGDFNAVLDHAMMHDLSPTFDAALAAGRGAEGTWPARLPPAFAAPIDHVLVTGDYIVLGSRTQRVGGSDHRAVIARLALR